MSSDKATVFMCAPMAVKPRPERWLRLAGRAVAAGLAPPLLLAVSSGTLMAVGVVTNFYDATLFHDIQFSACLSFIAREGREKKWHNSERSVPVLFRVFWGRFSLLPRPGDRTCLTLPPWLSAQVPEDEEEELHQEATRMLER